MSQLMRFARTVRQNWRQVGESRPARSLRRQSGQAAGLALGDLDCPSLLSDEAGEGHPRHVQCVAHVRYSGFVDVARCLLGDDCASTRECQRDDEGVRAVTTPAARTDQPWVRRKDLPCRELNVAV